MYIKPSYEEIEYFFILKLFNDDYRLLVDAIKELALCTLMPGEILAVIEDIRFLDVERRKRNYDRIKDSVEKILDLDMDTINTFKQNKTNNLFGYANDDTYLDTLYKNTN